MKIDNLSFKIIHKEELINSGNFEFIKKYFKMNDEKFINEMIVNLYNDLNYNEIYDLLNELKNPFLEKLYELKNELNLTESNFLLFKQIINLNLINSNLDFVMDSLLRIDSTISRTNVIVDRLQENEKSNVNILNENLYMISEAINKPMYHLEKADI